MGHDDLARLQETVGRVLTRAQGDLSRAQELLGRQLREDQRHLVVAASEELGELGSEERRRTVEDIVWAHKGVNDVLAVELPPDAPQWRMHGQVARGLVDVIATAVRHYHHAQ